MAKISFMIKAPGLIFASESAPPIGKALILDQAGEACWEKL